jgi:predicted glycoside hydrolase/deacetylase ChbG (UPF0249 family)
MEASMSEPHHQRTARHLITRGDDFGSMPEANRAIVDSCRRGVLRNASVMAPANAFADAAELARGCPELCVGLHVAMSAEWVEYRFGPVCDPSEVPSLVDDDGLFLSSPMAMFRRGVEVEELMREARAQLARARKAGIDIRYLDEHMGVSWLHGQPQGPRFEDGLRALAREEGLIWFTDAHGPGGERFGAALKRPWSVEQTIAALDVLPAGPTLFMTHPVYNEGYMARSQLREKPDRPRGSEGINRQQDTDILMSPRFADACAERGVRCVSYVEAAAAKRSAMTAGAAGAGGNAP